jgi:DNA-binding SARP family transcriptional activator
MQFRILGPLEVADGQGAISFDAPKHRALLAILLLHANEVVSGDRLIDELWGERPPATATKVLQTYVSQLRKALGRDLIVTQPPGYLIRVEDGALDAERFRRLTDDARVHVANGEPAKAEAVYREALALWRGPPLADVVFESFARNEVERLDEERIKAIMDRVDCELALGRQDELVAELETLVGKYPLRERLRAQLMLALYRSGRQADALAAYHDARRMLVDELGLEPSTELQALERAILTHDADLAPPSRTKPARTARRRQLSWRAAALAVPILIVLVAGLAFVLGGNDHATTLLAPKSVGFIDAESGRLSAELGLGREPSSLIVAFGDVWIATYRDTTVTRFDPASHTSVTIPAGGHPTSLVRFGKKIFVWTIEHHLVPIDVAANLPEEPIRLGAEAQAAFAPGGGISPQPVDPRGGRITSGGAYLWITAPPAFVLRVHPALPGRAKLIAPNDGVRPAIAYGDDATWLAGYSDVIPLRTAAAFQGRGVGVGHAVGIAFGAGSMWVVSVPDINQTIGAGLRRVNPRGPDVVSTPVTGGVPIAVASAAGSIWVASRSERTVERVDPTTNDVVEKIPLGRKPVALAGDAAGVWVAVD